MIIDADSHFFEPLDWLEKARPSLNAKLPPFDLVDMIAAAVLPGDSAMDRVPAPLRPNVIDLMPGFIQPVLRRLGKQRLTEKECKQALLDTDDAEIAALGYLWRVEGAANAEERINFLNARSIDCQLLNPSAPGFHAIVRARKTGDPVLVRDCMYAWNSWAFETLESHSNRLWATARISLNDMDSALAEMKRARKAGARGFNPGLAPVNGKSLAHPDFERVWALAEDLGLVLVMHIGMDWPDLPTGWANDGSGHLFNYFHLCKTQNQQTPELALGALILGGVLDRHPNLPIVISEFGVSWLPHWLEIMDSYSYSLSCDFRPPGMQTLPHLPSEYVARQVFVTPLPEEQLRPTFTQVPGVMQFATDYPHPEGSPDAMTRFDKQLIGVGSVERSDFYGERLSKLMDLH